MPNRRANLASSSTREFARTATIITVRAKFSRNPRGTARAQTLGMNPQAEQLKHRTFAFAIRNIRFCRTLRMTWEGRELSDQLFRAGTRVGANYRSACYALSDRDFVVKIGRVVEEADETVYWLELVQAAAVVRNTDLRSLLQEASELSSIFNQSQLTAKRNLAAKKARKSAKRAPASP